MSSTPSLDPSGTPPSPSVSTYHIHVEDPNQHWSILVSEPADDPAIVTELELRDQPIFPSSQPSNTIPSSSEPASSPPKDASLPSISPHVHFDKQTEINGIMNHTKELSGVDGSTSDLTSELSLSGQRRDIPTRHPSSFATANLFSILTWSWTSRILKMGYKRAITDEDLETLMPEDSATEISTRFQAALDEQRIKSQPLSVARALYHTFGWSYAQLSVILIFYTIVKVSQPLLLGQIVNFVALAPEDRPPLWYGYLCACLMGFAALIQAAVHHQYFFRSQRIGVQARNACNAAVFRKALALKTTSFLKTTTGQVVNLISNDTGKFEDLAIYLHYAWHAPFEASVILALMIWTIGISALFGVAVFLMLMPLQTFFSRKFSAYRKVTVKHTDQRVKTTNEILVGSEVMKLYNWEEPLEQVVNSARSQEMASIRRAARLKAWNQAVFFFSPTVVSLVTFGGHSARGYTLDPSALFTVLSLLALVRFPICNFFPFAVERSSEAKVACTRLDTFLSLEELRHNTTSDPNDPIDSTSGSISLQNASFVWSNENEIPTSSLRNLNIEIKAGQLVGIVGAIGSCKSSLLAALLGEMERTQGTSRVTGTIAYSSQQPWIFAGTVRENIIFGRPFHRLRYLHVLQACCLEDDIQNLHAGDLTTIGEKGVNLSGGQKARVALARAVYSDADIYLFDDPLAAVDTVIARKLFDQCMSDTGLLRSKTRILVTHQTYFLPEVHHAIVLDQGSIKAQGTFESLVSDGMIDAGMAEGEEEKESLEDITRAAEKRREARRAKKAASRIELSKQETRIIHKTQDSQRIVSDEVSSVGTVGFGVYLSLFRASGGYMVSLIMILFMISGQAAALAADKWLAIWSSQSPSEQQHRYYIAVFGGLTAATVVLSSIRSQFAMRMLLDGSDYLHKHMFRGVLYSSMRFFEANPVGRILNRFSKDQSTIDEILPITFFDYLQCVCLTTGCIVAVALNNPFVLLTLVPILPLFMMVQRYYLVSSREIKRLEAVSRSPIYALFSSSLSGLMVVRAFGVEYDFLSNFLSKIDANTRAFMTQATITRWFGYRLDCLSTIVVFTTAILAIISRDTVSAASTGFAISYALLLTSLFQWAVRQSAEVENHMTSVERIVAYSELPPEGARIIPANRPPHGWPQHGEISFNHYKLRYREGLPLVLKGVHVHIQDREKIGVCGRTGAGKSSLFQALFRLVEADSGSIAIDGYKICDIGLSDLRSSLSIIPQNPVIFSGTLRYNLDPFSTVAEDKIWSALDAVQLGGMVKTLPMGLDTPMAEYGGNFSVGECQLLCVARAILKPSRILLVDEATANVDMHTDALIQAVIRERFRDRTVITIAHRLNTIMDCDKIMVMSDGIVAEFDTPSNLLSRPDSIFANMASQIKKGAEQAKERAQEKAAGIVEEIEPEVIESEEEGDD